MPHSALTVIVLLSQISVRGVHGNFASSRLVIGGARVRHANLCASQVCVLAHAHAVPCTGASEWSRKSIDLSTKLVGLDGAGQVLACVIGLCSHFGLAHLCPLLSPTRHSRSHCKMHHAALSRCWPWLGVVSTSITPCFGRYVCLLARAAERVFTEARGQ
jgi:hypothetical protein